MPAQRHAVEADDALVGGTLAGFRIVSLLSRDSGGTASYRAVDERAEEAVTLRLAPANGGADLAARFLLDARRLAGVHHPSLPAVIATGEVPEGAYAVTAEPPGRSLDSVLASGLPVDQAVRILEDVGRALDVVHAAGLLHHAVRPSNIVLGEWLIVRPLLTNFALGRGAAGVGALADDEQLPYASPEALCGEPARAPSDRYSLACTLFEVVTGAPPFGRSAEAASHGHRHEQPPPVTELRPDVEPALDLVLQRALAKDPSERYASAGQLASDVARALSDGVAPEPAPQGPSTGGPAAAPAAVPEPAVAPAPLPDLDLEPDGDPTPDLDESTDSDGEPDFEAEALTTEPRPASAEDAEQPADGSAGEGRGEGGGPSDAEQPEAAAGQGTETTEPDVVGPDLDASEPEADQEADTAEPAFAPDKAEADDADTVEFDALAPEVEQPVDRRHEAHPPDPEPEREPEPEPRGVLTTADGGPVTPRRRTLAVLGRSKAPIAISIAAIALAAAAGRLLGQREER